MSQAPFVAALVLGAVVIFWVTGAQNRLVTLRNAIALAWTKVQEALNQRAGGVLALGEGLRGPMAAEHGALDTWLAAHGEASKAAAAMAGRPVSEAHAQAWVAAESALNAAASRLLALVEQHPELTQDATVSDALSAWREGQAKLPFARQMFNDAAHAYNEAADMFPTRIVARGLRLSRAGVV